MTDVVKSIVCLSALGILSFFVGRVIPQRRLNENVFPFKLFNFEHGGRVYDKLRIRHWQKKLPDMSRISKRMMPKELKERSTDGKIDRMIKETCVAELTHAAISILGIFSIMLSKRKMIGVVLYAMWVLGNFPFIIVQRYNRSRLLRLKSKMDSREKSSFCTSEQ